MSDMLVIDLKRYSFVGHSVGSLVASDVFLGSDAMRQVVIPSFVVRVLGIIKVARDPVTLKEALWSNMDVELDGLPQLTISAFGDVIMRVFHNSVEDAHRWLAIALNACRDTCCADYMQYTPGLSFVGCLHVPVKFVKMVVLRPFAIPHAPPRSRVELVASVDGGSVRVSDDSVLVPILAKLRSGDGVVAGIAV
jgi:hypothetical protein